MEASVFAEKLRQMATSVHDRLEAEEKKGNEILEWVVQSATWRFWPDEKMSFQWNKVMGDIRDVLHNCFIRHGAGRDIAYEAHCIFLKFLYTLDTSLSDVPSIANPRLEATCDNICNGIYTRLDKCDGLVYELVDVQERYLEHLSVGEGDLSMVAWAKRELSYFVASAIAHARDNLQYLPDLGVKVYRTIDDYWSFLSGVSGLSDTSLSIVLEYLLGASIIREVRDIKHFKESCR